MIFVKFNQDGTYGFYTPEIHGEEILDDPSLEDRQRMSDNTLQELIEFKEYTDRALVESELTKSARK